VQGCKKVEQGCKRDVTVQGWCVGGAKVGQGCKGARDARVLQGWCKGGARVVQGWCKGGARVQGCRSGARVV
jgi:hypothetical protein